MIRVELSKVLRRPRTWVSVLLLCLLPTIVAVFVAVTDVAPRPGEGPAFLANVLSNGKLYPAAALGIVLPVFLPVAVAVVAGDAVAGEASAGTLRYLLVRPVGRTRLLVAKLVAVSSFVLLAVVAVAASGYVVGVNAFGSQPGTAGAVAVSGTSLSGRELAARTALMLAYVAWSMLGVAAVALFLSTVGDSALGAAIGGLALIVGSQVLVTLDAAGSVRDWLPTRYWLSWVDLFRDPILWRDIERGFWVQAIWVGVFLAMAWAAFTTRDVTS